MLWAINPLKLINYLIVKASFLKPIKECLLDTWFKPKPPIQAWFFRYFQWAFFRFEYLRLQSDSERRALSDRVMSCENGEKWARTYAARDLVFDQHHRIIPELNEFLQTIDHPLTVVQIGSSSGRELYWLATRNEGHRFIGIDIDKSITIVSQELFHHENVKYQVGRGEDIEEIINSEDGPFIFFACGSLQYLQPGFTRDFFEKLAGHNVGIFIQEPNDTRGNAILSVNGSEWSGNFAYRHNYRFYAESAGLQTKHCYVSGVSSNMPPESGSYYYIGATNTFVGTIAKPMLPNEDAAH